MKCKKHPKYKAIRQPKADCDDCWGLYHIAERFREQNKLSRKEYQKLIKRPFPERRKTNKFRESHM